MKRNRSARYFGFFALLLVSVAWGAPQETCKSVLAYDFPELLTGKRQSLCEYSGKVVLVVNTASQCGYTPQRGAGEALQTLPETRSGGRRGSVVRFWRAGARQPLRGRRI